MKFPLPVHACHDTPAPGAQKKASGPRFVLLLMLATLLASFLPGTALAGPWTKAPGEYYLKLGQSFYGADAYRRADGETVQDADYRQATTFLYGEYGLLPGMHVQAYLPFVSAHRRGHERGERHGHQDHGTRGPGDAVVGLQLTPPGKKLAFALRLDAKLPLYDVDPNKQTGAQDVPLGDGQVDLTTWLGFGGGFGPIPAYGLLELGYQRRTSWTVFSEVAVPDYEDSAALSSQVGYRLGRDVIVAWNASGVFALREDAVTKSYLVTGPAVFWPVLPWLALEADASVTPWSRNSADGWSVGLGASVRRGP